MAMGKPVVSTSIGALGIKAVPEEDIIIADEPDEFARRVVEVLYDERLREKLARNGRKLIEVRHSWEIISDKLNQLLNQVASMNHG